jgi:hypothetical protein
MFCTNCGTSNKDEAKVCINCSESLSNTQIEESLLRPNRLHKGSFVKKVNFLRPLFDFSFEQLVTQKIITSLYGLSILGGGLIALFLIIIGFKASRLFGMVTLFIVAPLIFLLTVIYSRVFLEMILVIFRMSDHMAERPIDIGLASTEENQESKDNIQWNI